MLKVVLLHHHNVFEWVFTRSWRADSLVPAYGWFRAGQTPPTTSGSYLRAQGPRLQEQWGNDGDVGLQIPQEQGQLEAGAGLGKSSQRLCSKLRRRQACDTK